MKTYSRLFLVVCLLAIVSCWPTCACGQFRNAGKQWEFQGSSKAAFADFDRDGWVDVYSGVLLKNESGKKFVPVKDSGIPSGEGIWGDYDNDGQVDLFLFTGEGALFKNLGDGKFKKVAFPKMPTINSRGAVWLDINNDAYLDLYVGGYEIWTKKVHPDAIYLNDGKGNFKEVWRQKNCYSARGVTSADFNSDGKVDVFVSNYRLQPNRLLKFDAKTLQPIDIAKQKGTMGHPSQVIGYTGGIKYPICGHTIGSCFGDLDNDGQIDLFVGNFSHPPKNQNRPQLLRNLGSKQDYQFEDKSEGAGIAWQESFASPALGDFDNDGNLDLYFTTVYATGSGGIKNFPVIYRNQGNWKFKNVTEEQKLSKLGPTYQAAWADIDNDGDLDLCSAGSIFVNEIKKPGNWIKLDLVGDGRKVNRSAIGATVRIKVGNKILTRHVETGTGEGNQNEPTLHFGLGDHNRPVSIDIIWPGKFEQTVGDLKPNQRHKVQFSSGK